MKEVLKKIIVLSLIAALGVSVCACTNDLENNDEQEIEETQEEQKLDEEYEYESNIVKNEDGTYTISLSGNPTTGYTWCEFSCESEGFEKEHLVKQISNEYISNVKENEEIRMGAGGKFTFTYEVDEKLLNSNKTGTTILTFNYRRPWESSNGIATYKVVFEIDENGKVSYRETK